MTNEEAKEHFISGPPLEPLDPKISVADELFAALKRNNADTIAQREAETGRELTFGQLKKDSLSVVQGLRALGVGEGTVIAVVTYNSLEAHIISVAAILVGAAIAPLDLGLTSDELGYFIKLIKPNIIFCEDDETLYKIERACKVLSCTPNIIVTSAQKHSHTLFKDLKQNEDTEWTPYVKNPEDHIVLIQTTSGTTGLPKGVMMTDVFIRNIIIPMSEDVPRSVLVTSPLFWLTGVLILINSITNEYTFTYLRRTVKENILLSCTQDYKIDYWITSPAALLETLASPSKNAFDITSLKTVLSGGASLSAESSLKIQRELFHNKVTLIQGYGMSEVGVVSACKVGSNKPGSSGLMNKGRKCKIENLETGDSLGPGLKGEICIKAPYTMKEYINNPEATAGLFDKDGWVHTGDIGYYDEEGYLFVIDRIKELIKYKLFHISPSELEDILRKHPAVKETVVVGVPHPTDGDHATAFVVTNNAVSEHELVQFVAERVSENKQLRGGVRFLQEIPYTPTGKPMRKALRDQLIEEKNSGGIQCNK